MSYFTLVTMTLGVMISAVAGMICYLGAVAAGGHINWLPCADMMLNYPQTALGFGGALVFLGIICQPSRI